VVELDCYSPVEKKDFRKRKKLRQSINFWWHFQMNSYFLFTVSSSLRIFNETSPFLFSFFYPVFSLDGRCVFPVVFQRLILWRCYRCGFSKKEKTTEYLFITSFSKMTLLYLTSHFAFLYLVISYFRKFFISWVRRDYGSLIIIIAENCGFHKKKKNRNWTSAYMQIRWKDQYEPLW